MAKGKSPLSQISGFNDVYDSERNLCTYDLEEKNKPYDENILFSIRKDPKEATNDLEKQYLTKTFLKEFPKAKLDELKKKIIDKFTTQNKALQNTLPEEIKKSNDKGVAAIRKFFQFDTIIPNYESTYLIRSWLPSQISSIITDNIKDLNNVGIINAQIEEIFDKLSLVPNISEKMCFSSYTPSFNEANRKYFLTNNKNKPNGIAIGGPVQNFAKYVTFAAQTDSYTEGAYFPFNNKIDDTGFKTIRDEGQGAFTIDNIRFYNMETKEKLDNFEKNILACRLSQCEEYKTKINLAEKELKAAEKELEAAEKELKAAEKELEAAEKELEAAEKNLEQQKTINTLNRKINGLNNNVTTKRKTLQTAKTALLPDYMDITTNIDYAKADPTALYPYIILIKNKENLLTAENVKFAQEQQEAGKRIFVLDTDIGIMKECSIEKTITQKAVKEKTEPGTPRTASDNFKKNVVAGEAFNNISLEENNEYLQKLSEKMQSILDDKQSNEYIQKTFPVMQKMLKSILKTVNIIGSDKLAKFINDKICDNKDHNFYYFGEIKESAQMLKLVEDMLNGTITNKNFNSRQFLHCMYFIYKFSEFFHPEISKLTDEDLVHFNDNGAYNNSNIFNGTAKLRKMPLATGDALNNDLPRVFAKYREYFKLYHTILLDATEHQSNVSKIETFAGANEIFRPTSLKELQALYASSNPNSDRAQRLKAMIELTEDLNIDFTTGPSGTTAIILNILKQITPDIKDEDLNQMTLALMLFMCGAKIKDHNPMEVLMISMMFDRENKIKPDDLSSQSIFNAFFEQLKLNEPTGLQKNKKIKEFPDYEPGLQKNEKTKEFHDSAEPGLMDLKSMPKRNETLFK